MNVLFLTLLNFESLSERNIYTDLLNEFVNNGHMVYAISPVEKKEKTNTHFVEEDNAIILRLRIGNIQKTSTIKKGISTLMIGPTFKKAIKNYFSDVKFDMVIYSTPPITFVSAIEYVKKRDRAYAYLLLKDIFPQNAVDIGMMSVNGIKGLLFRHFRKKEKKLYKVSDGIGCMSQANEDYVIRNNPDVDPKKVEVCPNSIKVTDKSIDAKKRKNTRDKYNIPNDAIVFVYGGNLGKPQGIPFLIQCLKKCSDMKEVFFLIVGDGTEYHLLKKYYKNSSQKNLKIMKYLPKEDYEVLVAACDVGLIFLDYRFTIPNFPSRLLSYLQAKLPVLAVTDTNTDIGKVIKEGKYGWWCESNDLEKFRNIIESVNNNELNTKGLNGYKALCANYSVEESYRIIISSMNEIQ